MAKKKKYDRKPNGRPENAGAHNFGKDYLERHTYEAKDNVMGKMLKVMKHGIKMMDEKKREARLREVHVPYETLWTDEEVLKCIEDYFTFCSEEDLKPYKNGIAVWMGISSKTIWKWKQNKSGNHSTRSEIIDWAHETIEGQYVGRSEKYPTANKFLLQYGNYGYVDKRELEITDKGSTSDEIKEKVKKLGFDEDAED